MEGEKGREGGRKAGAVFTLLGAVSKYTASIIYFSFHTSHRLNGQSKPPGVHRTSPASALNTQHVRKLRTKAVWGTCLPY